MDVVLFGIPVVALIIVLIQAFKKIGLPTNYAPFVSIVLGILGMIGVSCFDFILEGILKSVVFGIVTGSSASGLWDAGDKGSELLKRNKNVKTEIPKS